MKLVLLYANQDEGCSSRLNAALCIASQFDATIQCVQVTPFQAIIMGDPLGGVYALPTIVEHVSEAEDRHKQHLEQP